MDFSGLGGIVSDVLSGVGGLQSADGYEDAAARDEENAAIVMRSKAIQQVQADRQTYQVLGTTEAVTAANGLSLSGSSLDLMKSNAQQLSLDKVLTENQGQMEVNDWLSQAAANRGAAQAAEAGGIGDIIGGVVGIAGLFSDERLKEVIGHDGEFAPGMSYYKFRFKGNEQVWRGLLAAEVLAARPDCVAVNDDGFYKVDYAKLGAEMTRG